MVKQNVSICVQDLILTDLGCDTCSAHISSDLGSQGAVAQAPTGSENRYQPQYLAF